MSTTPSVRQWMFAADPMRGGLEVLGAPCIGATLASKVDVAFAALNARDVGFLLVRLAPTDRAGVEAAIRFAQGLPSLVRVCFAIDLPTLTSVGARQVDTTHAGLLLDDVDARTPLTAIAHEAVEAIRFGSSYVEDAIRHARLGCTLAAMLDLARNLGIATLGPITGGSGGTTLRTAFDYTVSARSRRDPKSAQHGRGRKALRVGETLRQQTGY